jgi:hypothetical protein
MAAEYKYPPLTSPHLINLMTKSLELYFLPFTLGLRIYESSLNNVTQQLNKASEKTDKE